MAEGIGCPVLRYLSDSVAEIEAVNVPYHPEAILRLHTASPAMSRVVSRVDCIRDWRRCLPTGPTRRSAPLTATSPEWIALDWIGITLHSFVNDTEHLAIIITIITLTHAPSDVYPAPTS